LKASSQYISFIPGKGERTNGDVGGCWKGVGDSRAWNLFFLKPQGYHRTWKAEKGSGRGLEDSRGRNVFIITPKFYSG